MTRFLRNLAAAVGIILMIGWLFGAFYLLGEFAWSIRDHASFVPDPPCYPGTCVTGPGVPERVTHAPAIHWWMLAPAILLLLFVVAAITFANDNDESEGDEAKVVSDYVAGEVDAAEMESRLDIALGLKGRAHA